jgi:hypothetical protein
MRVRCGYTRNDNPGISYTNTAPWLALVTMRA